MARIRTIKPDFFTDEDIAAMEPLHRLCFVGLWCHADREGRLEDRPARLKVQILPYDKFDMEAALGVLAERDFIKRYEASGMHVIQIRTWLRHQMPGRDEPPSELPAEDGAITVYDRAPNGTVRARIYARDRYQCLYCDRDMTMDARARCVDHVIPYTRGGSNADANLATSCKKCNAKKGNRTPTEACMRWPDGMGAVYSDGALTGRQHSVNGGCASGQHPTDRNGNGNGSQEREKPKSGSSELALTRHSEPPAEASPVVLEFPTVGTQGSTWGLTQQQVAAWQEAYPSTDILAEAHKALVWVRANPGRRKTISGMPRFMVSWLNRTNDRGGLSKPIDRPRPVSTWRETCRERGHEEPCGTPQKCDLLHERTQRGAA